jgi:hypothetical protein
LRFGAPRDSSSSSRMRPPRAVPLQSLSSARHRQSVARLANTSHGVEPLFSVSSPRWYRLIGSAIPLRRSTALRSSQPWLQAPGLSSDAAPLVSLLSPSESDRTWMPPSSSSQLLLGFLPLQRFQLKRPGFLEFTSPDTVRLQGFAPSCRFPSS